MGLFLDKRIDTKYTPKYPSDCLVHTYNKKYCTDINTAETLLMNKVLLPGEVAFGYYYDEDASYGTNAIFAVGPLSNESGNIIFKNSNDIDKLYNELKDLINNAENLINDKLLDVTDEIDNLVLNTSNHIINISNNISNIINDASNVITLLNIYNTSIYDILEFNDNIENDLQLLNSALNNKIEDTSQYIINLLINSFKINDLQDTNNLPNVIEYFKNDLYSKLLNNDCIEDLSTRISNNTNLINNLWHNVVNHYIELFNKLLDRVRVLEHLILHVMGMSEDKILDDIIELIIALNSSVNSSIYNNVLDLINIINTSINNMITLDNLIMKEL